MRRQELKRKNEEERKSKEYEQEKRIMELEKTNSILKRTLKNPKPLSVQNRTISKSYSLSLLRQHQNKSAAILQVFKQNVNMFLKRDLILHQKDELGSGVFGILRSGFVPSIQQKVAVKVFSEKVTQADKLAEAKVGVEMSGHPNFPFVFGIIEPNKLLMEYIDGQTLSYLLKNEKTLKYWKLVCLDLVRALQALHTHGILHNDLHSGNIMLRNSQYVKIIDFGKATLIEHPVEYNIKKGTPKHDRYNKFHRHLGYELRNVPGSIVTCHSDVYSLGYNFDLISKFVKSEKLSLVSATMLAEKPNKRPELPAVLMRISKLGWPIIYSYYCYCR